MSERQRGRPPRRWVIRRLRLINFHNFVDETIEVRDGGHLFLLGDNGSGKTTVLDALHYVLGGGQDFELNAAARIGGRREEGRTIQGVVLRYDAERGVVNEGGAIAYAVVELGADDGEVLCLGVGVEATTLEARPVRWASSPAPRSRLCRSSWSRETRGVRLHGTSCARSCHGATALVSSPSIGR